MPSENKIEKIGNVTLDYTWYPGRDLYSDGESEERLLRLVRENREQELDAVVAREKDWSVLYHLSHVRENILGSIRVEPTARVLEIGAGCGAVTGALLGRCASLTCVDLSRRRSTINAERHKDRAPYTILVGNFQDIEPHLPQYDLITLIGVFEYARGYIAGAGDPYTAFLRQICGHLAPGGRIVIAIENRLGLKYFGGCSEDHTGRFFDGIENYPDPQTMVRTFSRPALEKIFADCGLRADRFYYPYPDYKLPAAIYSDAHLPAPGDLRRNHWNFDRRKLTLFSEDRAFDSLAEDGLFAQFANSFLVTLRPAGEGEAAEGETVHYTKFSDDRAPFCAIKTEIIEAAEGERFVRKSARRAQAAPHVLALAAHEQKLGQLFAGTPIGVNRVLRTDPEAGCVDLAYIDCGMPLEKRADALCRAGREAQAVAVLQEVCDVIAAKATQAFALTADFTRVFAGGAGFPEGYPFADVTLPVTDLDMVAENLICGEDGAYTLIDYEWTYDFPVPLRFVLFRIWHYFAARCLSGERTALFCRERGFSEREISLFLKMEAAWQTYVAGAVTPLRELHAAISPGAVDVAALLGLGESKERGAFVSSLRYMDSTAGSEQTRAVVSLGEAGRFTVTLDTAPFHGGALRWDPIEDMLCRVRIDRVRAKGTVRITPENGFAGEDGWDTFWTTDPVYRLEGDIGTLDEVVLEGAFARLDLYGELEEMNRLREMKNSREYKALERMKRVKARIKARLGGR